MKQLYMTKMVPPIPAGEHHTWTTRGPARFVEIVYPPVRINDDGELYTDGGVSSRGWVDKTPDFPIQPLGILAAPPEPGAVVLLESVQFCPGPDASKWEEQLVAHGFPLFQLCRGDVIAVAWPTFTQEDPLGFQFHNPTGRDLPDFSITFTVAVPDDFDQRWR